jgi:23S rRNA pseudoU1915 N3-methylase RlmH
VKIKIAWIGKTKEPAITSLTEEYLKRISHYAQVEGVVARDEADVIAKFGGAKGAVKSTLVLMDSRGR